MKKTLALGAALIAAGAIGVAKVSAAPGLEPEFIDVFAAGQNAYPSIRIPAVITAASGVVLAFAEGRNRPTDQASNDIILKRSVDGGKTWGSLQVVAEDGVHSLNNPTVVREQRSGRIFLMCQRVPGHLKEWDNTIATGYEGTNIYRNLLLWSDDDGATWTKPLDVTRATKRPTLATTLASGPGIGIQLARGPHAGRLLIPFNEGPAWLWNNFAVYSDDAGQSWHCGENAPGAFVNVPQHGRRSQINEVQMVELSDGSVRLNSRPFAGARVRKTALSHDGGATWSPIEDAAELRDPSCNASILRYSFDDGLGLGKILFCGPDSAKRANGTVRLSLDDGKTWPVKRALWPGSFAYSGLVKLSDGTVGCLFETDETTRLVFARFPLAWLESGAPKTPAPPK
jgi:sialidase-1